MKKLKLKLEYKCFPVWIYNDNNDLMINDLPDVLIDDTEIDPLCVELQETFDKLYINNSTEFKYTGFRDENKKAEFLNSVEDIEHILRKKVGSDYEIVNDINVESL